MAAVITLQTETFTQTRNRRILWGLVDLGVDTVKRGCP
jgi:hypothetical protein